MPYEDPGQRIRFSAFEVDLKAGELRKNGVKVKLQQQPLQVLTLLLQRPGEIVTREELRKELWAADTFVDFDHSLNAAIKRLRDALGESAESPVFIETLARRGYRFNTPLLAPSVPSAEAAPGGALSAAKSSLSKRRFIASIILASVVIAATAFGWSRFHRGGYSPSPQITSIAVLPLANLSRDPEQEYFSDGMTSAIIANLSDIRRLRVISRTSTERYKGTKKSLPEIAKELNVDAVIEGSVLRAGNRVRIDVELIDGATDQHLWSESYERELGDVLKLHGELAQAVADRMQVELAAEPAVKFRTAPAVNQAAYEDYLKGYRHWTAAGRHPQTLLAQQYFRKSAQEDPNFALAYAGLGDTYLLLGMMRRLSPQEAGREARENIRKALQIDPSLGRARASLGDLNWQYEWNWKEAEKEYRQAIEANRSNLEAHESYAWFLSWSGRGEEAAAEIALMRRLDPAFPLRCDDESGLRYHLRDYAGLTKSAGQGIELDPSDWTSHYFRGIGEYAQGKQTEAIAEFQRAVELSDDDQDASAALAFAYASIGKREAALKVLGRLQRDSSGSYVSPYMQAVIWAGLGDREKAFTLLEKAYVEKSTDLAYFIKADLRLDGLRSDARFQRLLARVGPPGLD
jgi:TolB-like protein/DNA-binding winged helix-turn-helix (wHTH) protein/Tfp pilus assembly protein PilF